MVIKWTFGRKSYRKSRYKRAAWRGVKQVLKEYPETETISIII